MTVLVLYANRLGILPRWLRHIRDTREKVTRTDSIPSTLRGIFTLFARRFPAGLVELYGNLAPAMAADHHFRLSKPLGATYCMYIVVVKGARARRAQPL